MQRQPQTFLSKAWSGSSLATGAQSMFAAFVKQEQALPDDPNELQKRVEERLRGAWVELSYFVMIPIESWQDLRRKLGMGPIKKVAARSRSA